MSRVDKVIELLEDKSNLVGAEIGVYEGESSKVLLDSLDIEKLYLIDPYEPYNEDPGAYEKNKIRQAKGKAHYRLAPYKEVQFIEKFSDEAVEDIEEELDFVYIDGNHTFEYCLRDIENYYPLVKEDGLICGDDFRPKLDEKRVAEAVRAFCHREDIDYFRDDQFWWFWK